MRCMLTSSSDEFYWEGYVYELFRCSWVDPTKDLDFFGSYIMGGEL